ncbi:MAG: A/G-specific adenine glycosylase [Desulfuromonadaceae bacterium]|nr:A/G-specific adenine glycosylase [Desulfuromonadaceae bacterium]MDD2848177.1 A/G-specific adenine glycosylase [Desulfuromonadaceae bacterium]MDD4130656.1 A/G-specific adenine glycosylase [Desulfuromonadaceae bacterium]
MLNPAELTHHYETGSLNQPTIEAFRAMILTHYDKTARSMPWRETRDPYAVLVSEIMLQQTQVERVRLKYGEFLTHFPTLDALSSAPLSDVLKVWQGLGYNRRAIHLKRCAEEIVARHNGIFPATVPELQALPGIGPYTARAVAAFAFDVAEPLIETNVRTVYIHFFFHGHDKVSDRDIMPLVATTLDHGNPREWYYALMDYGTMLKQLHPNPGQRSSHHTRQSSFEGSNRQLRSRILRQIITQPGITVKQLLSGITAEQKMVLANIEAMEREGFLMKKERGYQIADKTA